MNARIVMKCCRLDVVRMIKAELIMAGLEIQSDLTTGLPPTTKEKEVYHIDNVNDTQYDTQSDEKEDSLDISKRQLGAPSAIFPLGTIAVRTSSAPSLRSALDLSPSILVTSSL